MNEPYWIISSKGKNYEVINEDISTDYLIVGGGLTGVTCLYMLTKAGIPAVLIDAGRIGYGSTGRNTGKATAQHEIIYTRIEKNYGFEKAKQYYEINTKAIQFIEDRSKEFGPDCQFKRLPAYLFTQDTLYQDNLEQEFELYQKIGIDCSFERSIPLPISIVAALKMNKQAQFHPKRYVDAMAEKSTEQGGGIYEYTRVVDFKPGKECTLEVVNNENTASPDRETNQAHHKISAKNVIISSHYPCYDGRGFYFARLKPERSYIIGVGLDSFPEAHFINAEDPARSFRYIPEEKVLMVGGENHKVGHKDDDYYQKLKDYAKEVFGADEVKYQWSAQDYKTHDYIPYAGYLNSDYKNIFVATGYRKWGLTNSTASAMLISQLILEDASDYEELYSHLRGKDIVSFNFVKENADMAVQWVGGKLKVGDTELPEEKGVGSIVNINGKRCGCYRDDDDQLYIVDNTCPHMACELQWNSQERSWDCPCHGSRFDYKGNILEGPAEYRLNSFDEPKNKINPQIN